MTSAVKNWSRFVREACAAVLGALISCNVSKGKVSCSYYIAVEFNLVLRGLLVV